MDDMIRWPPVVWAVSPRAGAVRCTGWILALIASDKAAVSDEALVVFQDMHSLAPKSATPSVMRV
jgi:hypothetical protein